MSATNRGAKRIEGDFYATPESAFKPVIPFLFKLPQPILDPAEGDGRLVRWMRESGIMAFGRDISSGGGDFLKSVAVAEKTIVTNPPFSLALEFCQHALQLSDNVAMLLRLNFLAGIKRRAWWRENPPNAICVLSKRPSFTGKGTDATDYAWFFWSRHVSGIHFL